MNNITRDEARQLTGEIYDNIQKATGLTPRKSYTKDQLGRILQNKKVDIPEKIKAKTTIFVAGDRFGSDISTKKYTENKFPVVLNGLTVEQLLKPGKKGEVTIKNREEFASIIYNQINQKLQGEKKSQGIIYLFTKDDGEDGHQQTVVLAATDTGIREIAMKGAKDKEGILAGLDTKSLIGAVEKIIGAKCTMKVPVILPKSKPYTQLGKTTEEVIKAYGKRNREGITTILHIREYSAYCKKKGIPTDNITPNAKGYISYVVMRGTKPEVMSEETAEEKYLVKAVNTLMAKPKK